MRKVKLTNRIFYCHFEEPTEQGGNHGLLVLASAYNFPLQSHTVSDQEDFRFWLTRFAETEEEQSGRAALSRSSHAL